LIQPIELFAAKDSGGVEVSDRNAVAQETKTERQLRPSGKPFAIWAITFGLIFSALDLLFGISSDLPKLSSSSDPLLDIMVLFVLLCFVGAIGTALQKTWGYILAALVSFGFIIGANALDVWIPTLSNPHDFNTFIVADTIVPVLVLVAILSILCLVNRKKGLNQTRYLASARSFSGVLTVIIVVLLLAGAAVGAYLPSSSTKAGIVPMAISIVNGAFDPSNAAGHFSPASVTLVIGVNNTVTWTNNDYSIHTVTSNTGLFDSGLLNHGNSWTYTFTAPGTYGYHCSIHPFMTGTVRVLAGS
jgi:plastocyanin